MLPLDRQNALRERYRQLRPGWQPATAVYAATVRRYLRPDSRLLDLGCGRGGLVEQLGHPMARTAGVDPDWASLREHRLELPRATALSEALPFPQASFDLVMASWVLEHLAAPEATLAEIGRVLRPGGVFVFLTPGLAHPLIAFNRRLSRLRGLQRRLVTALYGRQSADTFPAHYQANRPEAVISLGRRARLSLLSLETIADPTYLAFWSPLFNLAVWLEERLPRLRQLHLVGALSRDP
jgi:SAM-dependent methyltransferase